MKKVSYLTVAVALFFLFTYPALATTYTASSPVYVSSSTSNTTVVQTDILWGVQLTHDVPITSGTVSFSLQQGDQVSVNWLDSSGNLVTTTNLDTSGASASVSAPSGAYGAQLVLNTGSSTGDRTAWWTSVANANGDSTSFPAPSTGGGSTEDGTTIDITPIVDSLQVIQDQLTTIQGQLDNISSGSSTSSGQLEDIVSAINNETSTLGGKLDDVTGQLDSIGGQLDDIKGQLDTIDSHVVDIYDYISTPRTSQPFTMNLPQMTVDPTPPPITEPPQQPYTYDRNLPQMPPFIDSPGPLPLAPDPTAMAHDPPAQINPPRQAEQPLTPDPVNRQQPMTVDPVTRDNPLQPDPVNREQPIAQDPVTREAPRTITPSVIEQPITMSAPVGTETPYERTAPIVPDPPM